MLCFFVGAIAGVTVVRSLQLWRKRRAIYLSRVPGPR